MVIPQCVISTKVKCIEKTYKLAVVSKTGYSDNKKWKTMEVVPQKVLKCPVFTGNTAYLENIEKRRWMPGKKQLSKVIYYDMTDFVPL